MRISDWSSDVCSSDLLATLERFARVIGRFGGGLRLAEIVRRRIRHLVHAATGHGDADDETRNGQPGEQRAVHVGPPLGTQPLIARRTGRAAGRRLAIASISGSEAR